MKVRTQIGPVVMLTVRQAAAQFWLGTTFGLGLAAMLLWFWLLRSP